jgi:hypothetical protein
MGKLVPLHLIAASSPDCCPFLRPLWITSLLSIAFFLLSAAWVRAQKTTATSRAIAVVAAIPEVKRLEKSQQHNKRISILLRDTPTVQHGYYWLQVGINSPVRYTPVYNFAVYPPQMTVGYINTLTDTVEPLVVWRRK